MSELRTGDMTRRDVIKTAATSAVTGILGYMAGRSERAPPVIIEKEKVIVKETIVPVAVESPTRETAQLDNHPDARVRLLGQIVRGHAQHEARYGIPPTYMMPNFGHEARRIAGMISVDPKAALPQAAVEFLGGWGTRIQDAVSLASKRASELKITLKPDVKNGPTVEQVTKDFTRFALVLPVHAYILPTKISVQADGGSASDDELTVCPWLHKHGPVTWIHESTHVLNSPAGWKRAKAITTLDDWVRYDESCRYAVASVFEMFRRASPTTAMRLMQNFVPTQFFLKTGRAVPKSMDDYDLGRFVNEIPGFATTLAISKTTEQPQGAAVRSAFPTATPLEVSSQNVKELVRNDIALLLRHVMQNISRADFRDHPRVREFMRIMQEEIAHYLVGPVGTKDATLPSSQKDVKDDPIVALDTILHQERMAIFSRVDDLTWAGQRKALGLPIEST